MATYPDWLQPDAADVRNNCGLEPHQLFSTRLEGVDDEERIMTLIGQHIESQSVQLWGDARTASGGRPFPSSEADLKRAYSIENYGAPDLEDRPKRYDWQSDAYVYVRPLTTDEQQAINEATAAQAADIALRIDEQKATARQCVEQMVYSKLWYSVGGEEAAARAKGYYITGRQLFRSLSDTLEQVSMRLNAQAAI